MLLNSLLVLAYAALTLASPVRRGSDGVDCSAPRSHYVLPVNSGSTELPDPPSNATLKYIALGLGIQNYTCDAAGETPKSTGAVAMLYDITKLFPGAQRGSLDPHTFNTLSDVAVDTHVTPLNLNYSTDGRLPKADPGVDATNPFPPDAPLVLGGLPLPFLGHHFFDSAGVPEFALQDGKKVLFGKKLASINPPPSANAGPDGTGAVAWLFLSDNGGSAGLKYAYRVLTAGGNPHGCTAAGTDSTTYSAQYWFYV